MKFLFQAALKQRNITEIFHLGDCVIIQVFNDIKIIENTIETDSYRFMILHSFTMLLVCNLIQSTFAP